MAGKPPLQARFDKSSSDYRIECRQQALGAQTHKCKRRNLRLRCLAVVPLKNLPTRSAGRRPGRWCSQRPAATQMKLSKPSGVHIKGLVAQIQIFCRGAFAMQANHWHRLGRADSQHHLGTVKLSNSM